MGMWQYEHMLKFSSYTNKLIGLPKLPNYSPASTVAISHSLKFNKSNYQTIKQFSICLNKQYLINDKKKDMEWYYQDNPCSFILSSYWKKKQNCFTDNSTVWQ